MGRSKHHRLGLNTLRSRGLTIQTGTVHRIIARVRTCSIEVELDPDLPEHQDDRVILRRCDGRWEQSLRLRDGEEPREGWTRLVFRDIDETVPYVCIIDPGAEGEPYWLFGPEKLNADAPE